MKEKIVNHLHKTWKIFFHAAKQTINLCIDLNLSCFNNKKLDMFKSMDDRKELSVTL